MEMRVADIILDQLGGNKFLAMTGAHHLLADGNTLRMQLTKNISKANRLWITLDADDTYTMHFFYYRAGGMKVDYKKGTVTEKPEIMKDVYKVSGIYFDQLQEIFTRLTGMYTHL
jgi:hypothetical protein